MEYLSKNKEKLILALKRKKMRSKYQKFIIEGDKLIQTAHSSGMKIDFVASVNEITFSVNAIRYKISVDELNKLSSLIHPNNSIAIVDMPTIDCDWANVKSIFYLDHIQDPGNLGTIIRTSDWFGIDRLVLSPDTVDLYNSKVVQASMGAIFKPFIYSLNMNDLIQALGRDHVEIICLELDGKSIKSYEPSKEKLEVFVFGNEGNGVRKEISQIADRRLKLDASDTTIGESLNVAASVAVVSTLLRLR